jgi:hypothetical protein
MRFLMILISLIMILMLSSLGLLPLPARDLHSLQGRCSGRRCKQLKERSLQP